MPLMPPLSFHKMHGAGNDFVLLDLLSAPISPVLDMAEAAQLLCARHFGVGADGLLTLEASEVADVGMRMWNPDGTPDMCGNGLRCVAALAHRLNHVGKREFTVETLAGVRAISLCADGGIRAAMGVPQWQPDIVPLRAGAPQLRGGTLEIGDQIVENVTAVSTGSTHTVIFRGAPLSESEFQRLSPLIENHEMFPARTSVMWAVPDGANRFQIRIWERGAGETLACGTGACAVAVAAQLAGRARGPIAVQSRGGALEAEWQAPDGEIYLTGPAEYVFAGTWNGNLEANRRPPSPVAPS